MNALEKVLERLGTTESTTLAVSPQTDGKIRIASDLWEAPKVILKGEVLEIRNVGARCTLLERLGITTNGTRRFPVYDPYGPGLRPDTTFSCGCAAAPLSLIFS